MSNQNRAVLFLLIASSMHAGNPQLPAELFAQELHGWLSGNLGFIIAILAMTGSVLLYAFTHNASVILVGLIVSLLAGGGASIVNTFMGEAMANVKIGQNKQQPKPAPPPKELTPFEKLVKQHDGLNATLVSLRSNIASIKTKLKKSNQLLVEKVKSVHAYEVSGDKSKDHIFDLKKENITRLQASIAKLKKELILNESKEKELIKQVAFTGEYVQEVRDAKTINADLPDGVLEVNQKWLSYERLYEEIEKELAVENAQGEITMELNEESGRVNGVDKLHNY